MQCVECGAENDTGSRVCWQCGQELAAAQESRPGSSWALWATAGVLAALVVFMMLSAGGSTGGGGGGVTSVSASSTPTGTMTATGTPGAVASVTPGAAATPTVPPKPKK